MIHTYDKLSIGKYQRIKELAQTPDNDLAVLAELYDKTEDELLMMPIAEYRNLKEMAAFLYYEPEPVKVRKAYKVGEVTVRLKAEPKELTTAQYIDLKENIKAHTADVAEYLAIVLIPEGKRYNTGYDRDALKDALREGMPTPDALSIRDFFSTRLGELTAASLTSSLRRMTEGEKKERVAAVADFLRSGGGLQMLMQSPSSRAALGPGYMR